MGRGKWELGLGTFCVDLRDDVGPRIFGFERTTHHAPRTTCFSNAPRTTGLVI